jgi:peptidoglycan/LPS O-acetylase OafA/YrhL
MAYVAASALGFLMPFQTYGNAILLPWGLLLGATVLSAGFTNPKLASRVLHRNDISYGMYIYHMPIFNFLLMVTAGVGWGVAGIGTAATLAVAILSWRLIERPALGLKRRTLLSRDSSHNSDLPKADGERQP